MDRGDADPDQRATPDERPPAVAALAAGVDDPDAGFFGPTSVTWRIGRESVLKVSGVSTILLQLAHPKVAAGVAEHSDFEAAPVRRLRRTFDLVYDVLFGDVDTAVGAALEIRRVHAAVTGTVDEDVGRVEPGAAYAASDPDLLLWVHATLIEQALTAYETYVGELPRRAAAAYYRESKTFGRLLGIPEGAYPETLGDFETYYEEMLATELVVGSGGRELKRALFTRWPPVRPVFAFLGAGTLPEAVREAFDLPWSPARRRAFDAWVRAVRAALPHLPARLRYVDEYRAARSRLGGDEPVS